MKIAIANDHGAIDLKKELMVYLLNKDVNEETITITDLGVNAPPADYPDYAEKVAKTIIEGDHDLGILLCGTGAGMCMSANKIKGIRAVVCSEPYTARLSREHNDANILCMGARVVGSELAKMIVDAWLSAEFETGGRHKARVDKIMALEG